MPMEKASRIILSCQYSGSNAAEILAMCQAITQYSGNVWSIDSDNGVTLRLLEINPGGLRAYWPITAGQVVVVAPDTGIVARMNPASYSARYQAIAGIVSDAVTTLVTPLVAAEVAKAMYGGFGVAPLPTLLLGATSAPIAVTIQPKQPGIGYVAKAFAISGSAVLAALEVVSMTNTSDSVVTVRVKATGVAVLGGVLLLHLTSPTTASG